MKILNMTDVTVILRYYSDIVRREKMSTFYDIENAISRVEYNT